MAISPYSMCPCGSGKQFKWCCQPYFAQIEKASYQIEKGQFAAADQTLKQLSEKYSKVPQVLGYQAELLYQQGKKEEAESVLQNAMRLDPNFARGHWLLGSIRMETQDVPAALKHFRLASELLHPNANEFLSQVLVRVAELEMELVHPIASRVAMERATLVSPNTPELRQAFEASFNQDSKLPKAARQSYTLREPPGDKSVRWQMATEAVATGKLSQALRALGDIAIANPGQSVAQFNLGLIRAWVGDNAKAIEAIQKSIDLESDEERIAEAVGLVEVLRCGAGLENECDYIEHTAILAIRDVKVVGTALGAWEESGRLMLQQPEKDSQVLAGMLMEDVPDLGSAVDAQFAAIQAHVAISQEVAAFTSPSRASVERSVEEFRSQASQAVSEPEYSVSTNRIGENLSRLAIFPMRGNVTAGRLTEELKVRTRGHYESSWLREPLKSLGGIAPLDAAGHPGLKKRLPGLIRFIEECVRNATANHEKEYHSPLYNFDRLRRKLGLAITVGEDNSDLELDTLSTEELGTIQLEALSDPQMGEAVRAALKLDSPDLAFKFALAASRRTSIADRYPYFNHLIGLAQEIGKPADVLLLLKEGEDADRDTNAGRRAVEYALARGRALARNGDVEGSASAFRDAIAKTPNDIRLFSPAAEAMLGKKNGPLALEFAEQGLKVAETQNNRDAQNQFQELIAAAKKLVG